MKKIIKLTESDLTNILNKIIKEGNMDDMSDNMIDFSDMVGFTRWVLNSNDFGKQVRYVYVNSKDYFIDDDRNRYSWEDMYKIYKELK